MRIKIKGCITGGGAFLELRRILSKEERFSKQVIGLPSTDGAWRVVHAGLHSWAAQTGQGREWGDLRSRMAVLSDSDAVEKMDGDLRGLLESKRLELALQANLSRKGVTAVELLAVLADDRPSARQFAKDNLGLDPSVNAADAIPLAQFVVAREAANQRMQSRTKADAAASTEQVPKSLPTVEFTSVKKKFEAAYYQLRDEDTPSKQSLEDLAEQLDNGDWRAMSLKEFAARSDVEADQQWGALSIGKQGQVKVKKAAVETPAPKDFEELRQKLKLVGHHFIFLRLLHPTRKELQDVTPFTFAEHADYLGSKRVAKLVSETDDGTVIHSPSLKQILTYDFHVKKKMMEDLTPSTPMGASLKEASRCPVTRERYFVTPLAVSAAGQAAARSRSPAGGASSSAWNSQPKGVKGKMKGKGKGKVPGKHTHTSDGRQICFAYNASAEGHMCAKFASGPIRCICISQRQRNLQEDNLRPRRPPLSLLDRLQGGLSFGSCISLQDRKERPV